jgi:hypothetical protein
VRSNEDGEANAGANNYDFWVLSQTAEIAAVNTLSPKN